MKRFIFSIFITFLLSNTSFAAGSSVLVDDNGKAIGTSSNPIYVNQANAPLLEVETVASDGDIVNNRNMFHSNSIITFNGKQYVGYWNSTATSGGRLVLCSRTLNTKDWSCYTYDGSGGKPTISAAAGTTDDHTSISLGVDTAGFIHVSLDAHSTALKYYKSNSAEDISNVTASTMVGTNETAVSYPIFFIDRNGKLYFTFRDGTVGNGDQYLYAYNVGAGTWAAATGTGTAGKMINGKGSSPVSNAYVSIPEVDSNNIVHFAWTWEAGNNSNNAFDVSYVAYNGTAFTKAAGTAQTMPITVANDDNAVAIVGDGVTNLGALITKHAVVKNSSGHIFIVYREDDANVFSQVYVVEYNGSSWGTPKKLTNDSEPFSVNTTTNYGPSRSPVIFIDSNQVIYVLFASITSSSGLSVVETSDEFATTNRYNIFTGNIGLNKITNFDQTAWRNSNELYLMNQTSGLPQAEKYTRRPIQLLHWKPTSGRPRENATGYGGFNVYDDLILASQNGWIYTYGTINAEDGRYMLLSPRNSIASALSSASSGDVIVLMAGTWTECVNVTTANVKILGISRENSIVTCGTVDEDTFNITASNVTVGNMNIKNTGGGSVTNLSRGVMVDGTAGTMLTGVTIDNVDMTITGSTTAKVEPIRFNDASGTIRNTKITGTSSNASTSIGIGMTGASTAESTMTVNAYNVDLTIDGRSTVRGISVTDSTDSNAITLNCYRCGITATENAASTTTGAITNTSTDASINLYNSIISGADTDVNNAGGGTFTLNNTILVNNVKSGTITSTGANYSGSLALTGTLTSSATGSLGFSVVAGADAACNATCTSACIFGQNTAALTYSLVDCADTSADLCLCAGSN